MNRLKNTIAAAMMAAAMIPTTLTAQTQSEDIVDVQHYDLTLTVRAASHPNLNGEATLDVRLLETADTLLLDLQSATVSEVRVNGEVVRELGSRVNPAFDQVMVDGVRVCLADVPSFIILNITSITSSQFCINPE